MNVNSVEGFFNIFDSQMGRMLVVEKGGKLVRIYFVDGSNEGILASLTERFTELESPILSMAQTQLEEYFDGCRTCFELTFKVSGTSFQKRVWCALEKIHYGETWSYQKQAESMGSPTAVRAVGQANGRNPLPIIIPCHRVVGKNGSLIGYGSGLKRKEWLLEMENRFSSRPTN